MAFFDVNPTDTSEVSIAAASTGNRARFIAFGFTNDGSATVTLLITDGASGTTRARFRLDPGNGAYDYIDQAGKSVFPKSWWTSGNAIVCTLSAAGSVRVWGEVVREA